jgi:hypothetical protein
VPNVNGARAHRVDEPVTEIPTTRVDTKNPHGTEQVCS